MTQSKLNVHSHLIVVSQLVKKSVFRRMSSKISEDQLFYCNQRGIPTEEAVGLIVNGYAKDVLNKLPMEFAVEAQKLLSVSLEGTVG